MCKWGKVITGVETERFPAKQKKCVYMGQKFSGTPRSRLTKSEVSVRGKTLCLT